MNINESTITLYHFEQSTYEELDLQVQNFTLDLLNQCRTSEEVRSLLNSTEMTDANTNSFPLLQVALQMEQKKVLIFFYKDVCKYVLIILKVKGVFVKQIVLLLKRHL